MDEARESSRPEDAWLDPLVMEWGDRLVQFAGTYTHDRDLAQDVVQDVFLQTLRWRRRYPDRSINPGWLYTVTRHTAVDHLHRRHRSGGDPLPDQVTTGPIEESTWSTRVAVQGVLDRLPDLDRQCLWLFYYAGLPMDEVATVLHLSPTAVKQRLYRARRRFARLWGGTING